MRRMFAEIEADVYVLVDGDSTYDAKSAPRLVTTLLEGDLDMVTAVRDDEKRGGEYRRGHRAGNRAFNWLLGALFGKRPADLFSGYRAFSRRFVKSFPASSRGFEIETEMTIHALEQRVPTAEIHAFYFARHEESSSKLSTYRDGLRILLMTFVLFKDAAKSSGSPIWRNATSHPSTGDLSGLTALVSAPSRRGCEHCRSSSRSYPRVSLDDFRSSRHSSRGLVGKLATTFAQLFDAMRSPCASRICGSGTVGNDSEYSGPSCSWIILAISYSNRLCRCGSLKLLFTLRKRPSDGKKGST